jgi:hypothetical protein
MPEQDEIRISIQAHEIFAFNRKYPAIPLVEAIKQLLKDKGAPLSGTIVIEMDEGWEAKMYVDINGTSHYTFRRVRGEAVTD